MTFINNLKGYELTFAPKAKKALDSLPHTIAENIYTKLKELLSGQQNLDVKKLVRPGKPQYRLRVRDYRVVYVVYEEKILICVVEVGHRGEIY